MNEVIIKNTPDYEQKSVDAAVEYIFEKSEITPLLTPTARVVVKLNLLRKASPEEAITTHPAVVGAVITALKKRGVKDILIADCPSGAFTVNRMKSIYSACGISQFEGEGVRLNYDFTSTFKNCGTHRFEIINPMLQRDVLINIAKLKTHAMAGMTGAVKNIFGVIPGLQKTEHHFHFPERDIFCSSVIELCEIVKPDLSIIDAVVGMEGEGPSAGVPRSFGFIIGGRNPYLVDRAAAHCIGIPRKVAATVDESVKRGLAPEKVSDITVVGDRTLIESPITDTLLPSTRATDCTDEFPRPMKKGLKYLFRKKLVSRPFVIAEKCVGCGNCAEACPQKTIEMKPKKNKGRYAKVKTGNCISCFCCHEVCPEKAIDIRKNIVFRVLH